MIRKVFLTSRVFAIIPFALLPLLPMVAPAQPWSGILSPSRATDWTKSGLPSCILYGTGGTGGSLSCMGINNVTTGVACNGISPNCIELVANAWTPPTRVQSSANLPSSGNPNVTCANTTADAASLNNALSASKPGSYVLFAGTCNITSSVVMHSGVTLRGTGPMTASLNLSNGARLLFANPQYNLFVGALSGSPAAGANTITVVSANGNPTNGYIARLSQCDTGFTGWTGFEGGAGTDCKIGSQSDNFGLFICEGDPTKCAVDNGLPSNNQSQGELFLITARSGDCTTASPGCNLTIFPPLIMPNWTSSRDAHVEFSNPSTVGIGSALEDASVIVTPASGSGFSMGSAYAMWVKGNRVLGAVNSMIDVTAVNGLIMNNYISGQSPGFLFNGVIEPFHRFLNYSTLLLNNIMTNGLGLYGAGYGGAEIIAYNFVRDTDAQGAEPFVDNCHGPGICNKTLVEGNQGPEAHGDDSHDTNNLDTMFRNDLRGWDGPFWNFNPNSVDNNSVQRFFNYIGNAMGDGTQYAGGPRITTYQANGGSGRIWSMPWNFAGASDTFTRLTLMRWGNCDNVTGSCRWCGPGDASYPACGNSPFFGSEVPDSTTMPASTYPNAASFQNSTPGNHNLPCSFFLTGNGTGPCTVLYSGGTGLPFWKVATAWSTFPTAPASTTTPPFPPTGPEVAGGPYVNGHAYDIPAAIAYKYLPIDPAQQVSYTITGSSWSNTSCSSQLGVTVPGPCETLTVNMGSTAVGAGNIEHVMGGFQLSGVNAACIPAGLPPNNEILMAGSTYVGGSTITVVYTLGSGSPDSGSPNHCTGTFQFPDNRQFDERVYLNDPSSVQTSNLLPPPTSTATPH